MTQSVLARLVREPLLHFLVLGAAIYGVYALTAPPEVETDERVLTVTSGEIGWLQASWEKRWGRPATEAELDKLIQRQVRETILYREAIAIGLDKEDVVIRRRLAQKLEFLSQDLLEPEPPTEEQLVAFFEENRAAYRFPDRITMTHVFFDPDKRGNTTLDDAEAAKAELIALAEMPADLSAYGDEFLLQTYYPERTEADLARLFGVGFAAPVFELETGVWHGPVLSGYGTHLVFVHNRVVAPEVALADVKAAVAEDYMKAQRDKLNEKFMEGLLARYTVVIEEPPTPPMKAGDASQ